MKNSIGLWIASLALAGFSFLGLSSCNVSESGEIHILRLRLHDSLTVEHGLFESIDIDLFDGDDKLTHADVFHGAYHRTDSAKLANLEVKSKIPDPVKIRITAYKSSEEYWVFDIKVSNGVRETLKPVHTKPVVPNPGDPLAPIRVVITSPTTPFLYLGDTSISLGARTEPPSATQIVTWSLVSGDAAVLESGDKLKALKAGVVTIKATSTRDISISATLEVTIKNATAIAPEAVVINNESPLLLTAGGPSIALDASVLPGEARQEINWTLPPNSVAALETGNRIKGLASGSVTLTASSAALLSVFKTLVVTVQDPPAAAPQSISLLMATPMILAVGGGDGDLLWAVLPAGTPQGVEWSSSDATVAQITGDGKVRPLKKGEAKITGKSLVKADVTASFDVNVVVPVKVDAISILPKDLTLYTGGPEGKLTVSMTGNDTGAQYSLASSDVGIAGVSAAGSVKGLSAGTAVITASVVGYPAVTSECSVRVVKDPPVVTVSANQNVAFNGEAVFTVSVAPQAYGSTVEIKADMDGDSVYELTVLNKETADFKRTYAEIKSTTVSFKVKDTEGNEETITRKVTVGAPGTPIVSIVNPSKDTSINSLSIKIRFTVKDTSQKIDTFVDSVVTLAAGSNRVRAARKNAAGMEGSDEVSILVDMTAPVASIAGAATQTTAVAAFSLAGTAGDLESGLLSVNVTGALSGNGPAVISAGDWSKAGLTLAEGANTLVATALDKAGNTKAASIIVTLDSKKPGTPTVTAPAAVRAGPIKWTWTKANADGSGKFKVKINAGPEIDAALAEYTLAATGMTDGTVYGLSVKETDPVAGDGPWSAEKKVLFDSKKPSPSISGTAGQTRTPEWKWVSNGGIGTFRWHYKGSAAGSAGTGTGTTFAPTTLGTGSHNLCVQEKDSPEWGEEWGTENCAIVEVDKTGPSITDIQYPDGYVTNQTSITISFKADLVAKPGTVCQLGTDKAENTCILSASDALGNPTTVTRKIWRRSNVVFVRAGATGTGASFDNAYGSLWQAINSLQPSQSHIWMMEGNYNIDETQPPFMRSGTSIYGGFSSDRNQSSEAGRNPNTDITLLNTRGTISGGGSAFAVLQIKTESGAQIKDITLDGLKFQPGYYGLNIAEAENVTISNCIFSTPGAAGVIFMENAAVTYNDCRFENITASDMLIITGNTVTFNRCTFRDNYSGSAAFSLTAGKVIVNNSTFQNSANFSAMDPFRWITVSIENGYPILNMYNCTIQGFGNDPGPIVTTIGDKWTVGGTGNHQ